MYIIFFVIRILASYSSLFLFYMMKGYSPQFKILVEKDPRCHGMIIPNTIGILTHHLQNL